ncbi:MAG: two-component system, NarL family, sensor histidine kinase EvgS [Parcubacteria bacterium C7867-004]|nr:MAG: two-component system, NarL family, sensor histidine kinase EvgS [Parcubacteria bacterium C7867-004]
MSAYLTHRNLFWNAVLFAAVFAAAEIFSHLYFAGGTSPALILPASGIALAGVIIGGPLLWPGVFLGIFLHQLLSGSSLVIGIGIALANTLQALVGAWLLRKLGFNSFFSRVPDTIAFTVVAVFATMIVPTVGSLALAVAGYPFPRGYVGTWMPWWIGQVLSALIVTALLVRWLPKLSVQRTKVEWFEASAALTSLVLVDLLLFWTPYRELGGLPLIYLILGPLLWIALRVGPRFMTLALFLNAVLALTGTAVMALSGGNATELGELLFQTEIFIIMISFIFLILVSIAEERKDTANDLRHNVRDLEHALERIQREDEAKSRFIATLAHELRNPLAPLMTSLELLSLEKSPTSDTQKVAGEMIEHVKTMRHLLDDLLDISRISREKLTLSLEHVELHGIIAKSARTVEPLMLERRHTLTVSLPEGAVSFEADPIRLEQIIVNLLNNAAKYTEPGGTITLAASIEERTLVIRVRDSGIGMDQAMLERVFEPFFQIEHGGRTISGLGIGLSLTKNLVQMHGGRISALSEGTGLGSEFVVRIPLKEFAEKRTAAISPTTAMESDEHRFRILVIDDNRAAADGLVKLLKLRGHEASAVYTGEEGLAKAPEYKPEVVLLDIGLPDMEGYDVAKGLKADERVSAVLIALTGYGQDADIRKAEKAGFDYHLTKPAGLAEIEELLAKIAR